MDKRESLIKKVFKYLLEGFFIWFFPTLALIYNAIVAEELFKLNILVGLIIGVIINIIWDSLVIYKQKKEYHKYYL